MTSDRTSGAVTTGVGVLDRVMAILDAVDQQARTATEIAQHLGLSLPTAHRLIRAMEAHGLLDRDARTAYRPGPRFHTAAVAAVAESHLVELTRTTRESTQLWVRRGEDRVCQVSIESGHELRASLPVGTVVALSAGGSAAHVLLGEPLTPEGWVESRGERTAGLASVSAPVRSASGAVIAAVCLSAPLSRAPQGPARPFGPDVVAVAGTLSRILG
jgi:DNA-binding IclR family transcriptional regulator